MKRLVMLVTLVAACGGVGPKYAGSVRIADSRLVPINPDVKTVIDADQPVFFARGSYWLLSDGHWFRADSPGARWKYVAKPPVPVLQIDQPFEYVHYRNSVAGKAIETVAVGAQDQPQQVSPNMRPATTDAPNSRPAKDRQPAAVDPSVDPTVNLAPAL